MGGRDVRLGSCCFHVGTDECVCSEPTDWTFTTLDSGERVDFPSGMRRDTDKGKPRYDLIPLPMLRRLADLYARGAEKYGDSNWTLADSPEEVARFKASAFRHFVSWLEGDTTEDHAVAAVFNIFAADTIAAKIDAD
jgi:hypothetical protein